MCYSWIRKLNLILIILHVYSKSLCQDASLTIVTSAIYQQDQLTFGCSLNMSTAWRSVARVTLSKHMSSTTTQDIVTVILQTDPTIQNKTTWFSGAENWQSRADIIKQYVQPVAGSGIEFDIPPEQVLCSDEGTYYCKVLGQDSSSQLIEKMAVGTLSFIVYPTNINSIQVHPYQPKNIYNALTTVILTCSGTVGRPAGNITWCFKRPVDMSFSGWPFPANINQGAPVPNGCQNFRTSTLKYIVSAVYEYYEFKCVTGFASCNSAGGFAANTTIYKYEQILFFNKYTNECDLDVLLVKGCEVTVGVAYVKVLAISYGTKALLNSYWTKMNWTGIQEESFFIDRPFCFDNVVGCQTSNSC